jgi:hypothetical protein
MNLIRFDDPNLFSLHKRKAWAKRRTKQMRKLAIVNGLKDVFVDAPSLDDQRDLLLILLK